MLPCGAGVAVPGSLEKAGQQVVFTKAMTEVKHGKDLRRKFRFYMKVEKIGRIGVAVCPAKSVYSLCDR
jgi:hypothetical protein